MAAPARIIISFLFFCFLFSGVAVADDIACKCSTALDLLAIKMRAEQPSISTHAITGHSGFALMQTKGDKKKCEPARDISGLKYCPAVGVDQETVDLYLKIYHGLISEKAATEISKCYAAFFYYAAPYEQKYGRGAGEKLGYIFGKKVGSVSKILGYTFPQSDFSHEAIMKRTLSEYHELQKKTTEEAKKAIETYCHYCQKYELPIKEIIQSAWANSQ